MKKARFSFLNFLNVIKKIFFEFYSKNFIQKKEVNRNSQNFNNKKFFLEFIFKSYQKK
jgi:hypothetical protein